MQYALFFLQNRRVGIVSRKVSLFVLDVWGWKDVLAGSGSCDGMNKWRDGMRGAERSCFRGSERVMRICGWLVR